MSSGSQTNRTPDQTSASRDRERLPKRGPSHIRSTVAICVTLTTDARGRPASPFRSRTFPGSSAYLSREVIATTTAVASAVRLKRSCCRTTTGRLPAGSEPRAAGSVTQTTSPWRATTPCPRRVGPPEGEWPSRGLWCPMWQGPRRLFEKRRHRARFAQRGQGPPQCIRCGSCPSASRLGSHDSSFRRASRWQISQTAWYSIIRIPRSAGANNLERRGLRASSGGVVRGERRPAPAAAAATELVAPPTRANAASLLRGHEAPLTCVRSRRTTTDATWQRASYAPTPRHIRECGPSARCARLGKRAGCRARHLHG